MSYFKRFVAAISTLAIVLTLVPAVAITSVNAATSFTDLDSISNWAVDSVNSLVDQDVMAGNPDGSFDPKGSLNRASMAQVAVKAAGFTEDTTGAPHFNDVASSDWYYVAVETLYNNGVVGGINGGALDASGMATYDPSGIVNRATGAKIIGSALGLETAYAGTPPNFLDVPESAWFYDDVESAFAHGILNGYDDGNFGPSDAITREQIAVIAANGITESADGSKARSDYTVGAASDYIPGVTPPVIEQSDGTLNVALSASTPASNTLPASANVAVASWDFTASSAGDVTLTSIIVKHGGVGARAQVIAQVLKDGVSGVRLSKSKGSPNSDDETTFNLNGGGLVIPAGTTKTIELIITTGTIAGEHNFSIASAETVNSNAKSVTGSFPSTGNTMTFGVAVAGSLTMANDGTPASVKVGETDVKIAKFKLTNGNTEDINLASVTLKETGTASEASAITNIKLWQGTTVVATGTLADKYISFVLDTPFLIAKNKTEKFSVTADIIGETAKTLVVDLNNTIDIEAEGLTYGFGTGITDSFTASTVNILAGDITIVKAADPSNKIRRAKTDVVLAEFDVTVNSGDSVDMVAFNATVTVTGDAVQDMIENVELYDIATGAVYDLSPYDATTPTTAILSTDATTAAIVYADRDLDISFAQGVARTFQLRADTRSSDIGGTTTVFTSKTLVTSLSGIGDSTTTAGIDFQETIDDNYVTDVTPASLSFKTMTGTASSVTLTNVNQSATKNAVVGASDIEGLIFELEAGTTSDLVLDEVKVKGTIVDTSSVSTTVTVAETTAAVVATGSATVADDLLVTADAAGTTANGYTVIIVGGGADTTGEVVSLESASTVTITCETDGGGAADSTWAEVVTAANLAGTFGATVSSPANGADTVLVGDAQTITLAGGVDEISTITLSGELIANDTATIKVDALVADSQLFATSHAATMTAWAVQIAANATIASATASGNVITVTGAAANGLFTLTLGAVTSTNNDGTDTLASSTRINQLSLYEGDTLLDTVSGSSLTLGIATFDGFLTTIEANTTKRYTLKIDFIDDDNQNNDTVNWEITSLSLEDDDSDDLTAATCSGTCTTISAITGMASARTITIVGTGTLTIAVDNTDLETNAAKHVLGDTNSDFVASYELIATNEGAQINSFTIVQSNGAVDMQDGIAEIIVYASDKTTVIARKSVGSDTITFTDVPGFVVDAGSENIYIKVVGHKMGLSETGAIVAAMTLTFQATDVEGAESDNTISTGAGIASATSASNAFTTIPTQIVAVSLESSYGGEAVDSTLTNGSNNLAILKLTTADSNNTDADTGGSLKTLLTGIGFNIVTNATTVAATDVTIDRIGGTGDYTFAAPTSSATVAGTEETVTITTTMGSVDTVNKEIDNGDSAYFLIKMNAAGLTDSTKYFAQVKFTTLDGGDIDYSSNDTTATTGLESGASDRAALYVGTLKLDGTKVSQ